MLTLLPLSGLQDAFKRRNSTTMDKFTDRRGSISVYDTYSLPTSKADMRRFSSYEQLAPFFQQIFSQENNYKPAPPPAPVPPSTSTTSNTSSSNSSPDGLPPSFVRGRRGSISRFTSALTGSFRRQKSVAAKSLSESEAEVSCDDLDAQIAKIKGQLVSNKCLIIYVKHVGNIKTPESSKLQPDFNVCLCLFQAQFKSEDEDMSQRVEELSSSVEELYTHSVHPADRHTSMSPQDQLYFTLRQKKMGMQRSHSFQNKPSSSTYGLKSISESVNESSDSECDEDDYISFKCVDQEDICLRHSSPVRRRSRPSSYASISEEPEHTTQDSTAYVDDHANTKDYCILNNTVRLNTRHRPNSMPQCPNVIRNDLTQQQTPSPNKRHSIISVLSDSVLITQHYLPTFQPLMKEHEF